MTLAPLQPTPGVSRVKLSTPGLPLAPRRRRECAETKVNLQELSLLPQSPWLDQLVLMIDPTDFVASELTEADAFSTACIPPSEFRSTTLPPHSWIGLTPETAVSALRRSRIHHSR